MKKMNMASLCLLFITCSTIFLSCKKDDATEKGKGDSALPHTKKHSHEVATEWFTLLTQITRSGSYPPAPSLRLYVYNGLALYESVVPGMPSYNSIYKHFTDDTIAFDKKKEYYWPACANAAMASITTRILQNYPVPAPNLAPVQALESKLNALYQAEVSPERLQLSIEFGKHVANKIYAYSTADGTLNSNGNVAPCAPYVPLGTPGSWVPTPPGFFPAAGACQGNLRTFIPNIVNQAAPAPPPVYSTTPGSAFHNMANEIYQLSLNLTDEDLRVVRSWRDLNPNYNPPSHVMKVTTDIVNKEKLDLEAAAVLYAQESIALFDAVVAVFKAKFQYALLRPITYIRNVMGYTSWNTVIPTPQHPAYPSTAVVASASAITVLEKFFGSTYVFTDSTQTSLHGNFNYTSLNGLVQDVSKSRTHGGINFKPAVEAAVTQGRQVGQLVLQLPFKK